MKTVPDLPKLEIREQDKELMSVIAGDWLAMIGPSLRDLSSQATAWWAEVVQTSQAYYHRWLESGPIDRLLLRPDPPSRYDSGPDVRLEQRAVAMLLKAVPSNIKEDVAALRRLTSIDIISTILTTFQPGGLKERSAVLKYLTAPDPAKTISEALKGIRRWARWNKRALELQVAIPDATLLIAGLDQLTLGVVSQHPEASFRLQTFRHQHNVDHIPTQDKAVSLGQMLQAELQALEHAGPNKRSKVARIVDTGADAPNDGANPKGGKTDGKGKPTGKKGGKDSKDGSGSGETKACYHWMSKTGCKMG